MKGNNQDKTQQQRLKKKLKNMKLNEGKRKIREKGRKRRVKGVEECNLIVVKAPRRKLQEEN